MKSANDHNQLKATFENALLHLYIAVSEIKRTKQVKHVPEAARNQIIVNFIKPKLKDKNFSTIKKNLKTITMMGNKLGSIENHLKGIVHQYKSLSMKTDIDYLYDLFSSFEASGLETMLIEEKPESDLTNIVFIDRSHVDHCFSTENKQTAPLSLFIHTNDLSPFLACLNEQQHFQYELEEANKSLKNYHYKLHPYHIKL